MKEIKLKAWSPTKKIMGDVESINFITGAVEVDSFVPENEEEVILRECTGLKDKNGVEIYEGDIVLNHFGNQKLIVFWDTEVIGSKGGGWNYKKLPKDEEMMWMVENKNIEIIGNIYENPELITNSK